MSLEIETIELIDALQKASKEALDVVDATQEEPGAGLETVGHNEVRAAARDAHKICNNLLVRLGGNPISRPKPEPEVIEKLVEVPDPALTEALEQTKRKLDEALASRGEPEPQPEMPPEGIADLFQDDRPYPEQAKALWDRYNELTQKIMLKVATDAEREKHTKLQGELDWIKRHAFEGI